MTATDVQVGDVVQIDPEMDDTFGACFLVVTEVKPWGVQGYVTVPGHGKKGGAAYLRPTFDKLVRIGCAEWARGICDEAQP